MKKIIIILALVLFVSACNHEKDYPTSLFGVKLLDKTTNYMTDNEWNDLKEKNKKYNVFATTKGKYQKNNMFQNHYMYANPSTDIIYIVGATSESGVKSSEFSNTCRNKRNKLLNNLKDLKNIYERNFKKEYVITTETNSYGNRSDNYKEIYSLNYEKENNKYDLKIVCKFSYADENHFKYWKNTSSQILQYFLLAVDKNDVVTDKDIIDTLNAKVLENVTILKKPLTDEVIKNDFRGL